MTTLYLSNRKVQLYQQLICHCISALHSSTLHLSAHAWTRWDNDKLGLARTWSTHTFKSKQQHIITQYAKTKHQFIKENKTRHETFQPTKQEQMNHISVW